MSVATIDDAVDRMLDQAVAEPGEDDVADVAAWVDHSASLRRPFTGYMPRHRADGPAL